MKIDRILALAAILGAALDARAMQASPTLAQLQAVETGGSAAYAAAADGDVARAGAQEFPAVRASPAAPAAAPAATVARDATPVVSEPPSPSERWERGYERHERREEKRSSPMVPLIGAAAGGALGYALTLAFCLGPWATAGFILLGVLAGAGAAKAFF